MPKCYDCHTEEVAVKVIDLCGFEQWFCAEDWAANQAFHDALMKKLTHATATSS